MIINLTQHVGTPEQGVHEPENKKQVLDLLNFSSLPSEDEISVRASALTEIAKKEGATGAMVGGAPYLMSALERALWKAGVAPLYAFSTRESVEETLPDGSVRKMALFRHRGFVTVSEGLHD